MSRSERRWFRFSLRMLLIITAGLCIVLGVSVNRARSRKAAVLAIDELGGGYGIVIEGPEWLRNLVDDDKLFYNLARVSLGPRCDGYDPSRPFGDEALRDIIPLLNKFSEFSTLHIPSAPVTDSGMSHLKKLNNLERLYLTDTQVSDAGLENLAEVKSLKFVHITGTAVTRQGVARFQTALPNCEVVWDGM